MTPEGEALASDAAPPASRPSGAHSDASQSIVDLEIASDHGSRHSSGLAGEAIVDRKASSILSAASNLANHDAHDDDDAGHDAPPDPEAAASYDNAAAPPAADDLLPIEGLAAWLNVLGSFLTHFFAFGNVYSFSLFVTTYSEEFNKGRAEISFVYQLQVACQMALGFFTGRLADRFGVRPVYLVGVVFITAGLFIGSFVDEFWQMVLTHGLLVGIGNSCVYWPAITVVPQWFNKRRAMATGLAVFGAGLGNFALGLIIETMLRTHDFRFTLRILALFSLVSLGISSLLLKRRLPNVKARSFCAGSDVLRNKNFILIAASAVFFQTGYNIPFSALSPFIEDRGFDKTFAAFAVGAVGIGSAVGRILLGIIADRVGRIVSFQFVMFGTGVVCAVWYFCTTEPSIVSFAVLFGFFSGGFIALVPVVMSEYFGVDRLGTIMGYIAIGLVPGSFIGPYMGGHLFDVTGDYKGTTVFSAVTVLFASCLLLPLTNPKTERRNSSDDSSLDK